MVSRKIVILGVLLILVFGSFVRLWNIHEKGLFFWDEGLFLMGSKFVSWRIAEVVENIHRFGWKLSSLNSDVEHFEGYPVFLQKPGHVLLLTAASLLLEVDDRLGQAVSAFFGVLSIFLVYLLGTMAGGRRVGLIAALFCALAPTHIHYSRVGLHEITSTFFVLMAVYIHLLSLKPNQPRGRDEVLLFFAGVGLSSAIICSYRWIVLIPLFMFMDIVVITYRSKKTGPALWRGMLFVAGFLIPLSFAEFSYFICFYPDYLRFQPSSYFWVLIYKFSSETRFDFSHPFHYLLQLGRSEGLFFLALVSAGLAHAASHKNRTNFYLFSLVMLPFILYSLNTTRVARAISILLPFMAILAAMAVIRIQNRLKNYRLPWRLVTLALILFPLTHFIMKDITVVTMKSGYGEAFEFLQLRSNGKHFSTMAPIGSLRFGHKFVPLHPPQSLEEMRELCAKLGFRYVLVDWQKYVWNYTSIQELEKNYQPVITISNSYVNNMSVLNENYIPGWLEQLLELDPTLDTIKIYDLNSIFNIPVPIETIMVRSMHYRFPCCENENRGKPDNGY